MTWEDFKDMIEDADGGDTPICDFMADDGYDTELLETGSVTVEAGGKSYIITLRIAEVP